MSKQKKVAIEVLEAKVSGAYQDPEKPYPYPASYDLKCKVLEGPNAGEERWFNGKLGSEGRNRRVFDALEALGGARSMIPTGLGSQRALAVLGETKSGRPCIDYINPMRYPKPSETGVIDLPAGPVVDELVQTIVDPGPRDWNKKTTPEAKEAAPSEDLEELSF